MNVMTKCGNHDNIITYQHICDTNDDVINIPAQQITLGSICIVITGESGGLEVYIANSQKEWQLINVTNSINENQLFNILNPQNGDTLIYNDSIEKWINYPSDISAMDTAVEAANQARTAAAAATNAVNEMTIHHYTKSILSNSHSANEVLDATKATIYPNLLFPNMPVNIANRENAFDTMVNYEVKGDFGWPGAEVSIKNNTLLIDLTNSTGIPNGNTMNMDVINGMTPRNHKTANQMPLTSRMIPGNTYKLYFVSSRITSNMTFYLYFFDENERIDSYSMSATSTNIMTKNITIPLNALYYRIYGHITNGVTLSNYAIQFYLFPSDVTITAGNVITNAVDQDINGAITTFPNLCTIYTQENLTNIEQQITTLIKDTTTYITPEMFGAKADAYTDDSAAINNCLAYAFKTGKSVKAHGIYYISQPITINYSRMDIYIHWLIYDGDNSAVILNGMQNKVQIGHIISEATGFRLYASEQQATENTLIFNEIKSKNNAFEAIAKYPENHSQHVSCMASYCEIRFRFLLSYDGDGIYLDNTYGEKSFYGGTIIAPNGWSIYTLDGSCSYYNIALEDYRGIYCRGSTNMFIGFRTAELMDKKRFHSENYDDPTIGLLFKFAGYASGNLWISRALIYKECIDISDMIPLNEIQDGIDASDGINKAANPNILFTMNASTRAAMYSGFIHEILVYPERIILKSDIASEVRIGIDSIDNGVLDLRTAKNSICYAKKFNIYVNCDIILDSSWCSAGINELIIQQENGSYARIYDCHNVLIFDGTKAKDGIYRMKAICDYWSENGSRYISDVNYYYFGENDYWEIERIDDQYRLINTITITEPNTINILTDSDGDVLDLQQAFISISIPSNSTYTNFEPYINIVNNNGAETMIGCIPSATTSLTSMPMYGTMHVYQEHGYWRCESTELSESRLSTLLKTNSAIDITYDIKTYSKINKIASNGNAPAGTVITVYGIRNIGRTKIEPLIERE